MAQVLGTKPFVAFLLVVMMGSLLGSSLLVAELGANVGFLITIGLLVAVIAFFQTRIAIYLLIFSMLLSPEFGAGGVSTSGRGATFRFDDFLLVLVGLSWVVKAAIHKELGILKKTPLNGAMLLYIFACALATLIGISAGRVNFMTGSLFVLKYTQYFVLFFMVINSIDDEKQLRRYWMAVILTALIVGTIGLAQIPTGQRVTAPFEGEQPEPNTFGGYLAFLTLICVSLGLSLREHTSRLFYLLVAFYLSVPLLFTLSRATYLGLIPGLAMVLFLARYRIASYALAVVVLSLVVFPQLLPEAVRERVTYTFSETAQQAPMLFGQRFDPSTTARLASFQEALADFPKKPIFGYGVTGWRFIDSQYFRTLLETGFLGFCALLILFFRLFQLGFSRRQYFSQDPFYRGLSIGFLGGLICLLVHALGSNTFIIVRIMEPFWLLAGLLFMSRFVVPQGTADEMGEPLAEAA